MYNQFPDVIVTKLSLFAQRLSARLNTMLKVFDILIRKRKREVGGQKTNINGLKVFVL